MRPRRHRHEGQRRNAEAFACRGTTRVSPRVCLSFMLGTRSEACQFRDGYAHRPIGQLVTLVAGTGALTGDVSIGGSSHVEMSPGLLLRRASERLSQLRRPAKTLVPIRSPASARRSALTGAEQRRPARHFRTCGRGTIFAIVRAVAIPGAAGLLARPCREIASPLADLCRASSPSRAARSAQLGRSRSRPNPTRHAADRYRRRTGQAPASGPASADTWKMARSSAGAARTHALPCAPGSAVPASARHRKALSPRAREGAGVVMGPLTPRRPAPADARKAPALNRGSAAAASTPARIRKAFDAVA